LMLPLQDENPRRRKPLLTLLLIALNCGIFAWSFYEGTLPELVDRFGCRPVDLLSGRHLETALTSMFLHGSWLHLLGNMLFLWIFGDNIEDAFGRSRFLLLYLSAGVVALLLHAFFYPTSNVPLVGASGAISGILGAYLVLFPRARVLTLVTAFYFWSVARVPAAVYLGFWILLQFLYGTLFWVAGESSTVAYWAHVGGFLVGAAVALSNRRAFIERWYF